MALLGLSEVNLNYTGPQILDSVTLQIEEGERIGLLGRNGAGKSSLFRVIEGVLPPDSGEVSRQSGLHIASLQQDVPLDIAGTVREYLVQVRIRGHEDRPWETETAVDRVMRDLRLEPDASIATLSAGSKRRVLLAAAFVADPDILLLDEPTNHLDIETIAELETILLRRRGALVFVTHDRSFLRRIANRILDLDRGQLRSYSCSYEQYLERREAELAAEAEHAAQFDKKLAIEEAWIRKGIKARRTRNEGRVRALFALREERRARRESMGTAKAELIDTARSGRIVLKAKNLTFAHSESGPTIVRDFSTTVLRGDRIGVIGPNGCGKTTLTSLLLGSLTPVAGEVSHGTKVEIAHFEQLHDPLDESKTVMEIVGDGADTIVFGGRDRHVMGYLQDFLFSPGEIRGPVRKLSGGERRRLQLARLLSRPSNVLVLDEPTNDLDLETLELLEDLLMEFQGTLLLISHDREFLNNVVTSTVVFEGEGRWTEYAGGYDDWVRQSGAARQSRVDKAEPKKREGSPDGKNGRKSPARPKKLTFKESRELEALPPMIETLEAEKAALFAELETPDFYRKKGDAVAQTNKRVSEVTAQIEAAYARWEELEALREAAAGDR